MEEPQTSEEVKNGIRFDDRQLMCRMLVASAGEVVIV